MVTHYPFSAFRLIFATGLFLQRLPLPAAVSRLSSIPLGRFSVRVETEQLYQKCCCGYSCKADDHC